MFICMRGVFQTSGVSGSEALCAGIVTAWAEQVGFLGGAYINEVNVLDFLEIIRRHADKLAHSCLVFL